MGKHAKSVDSQVLGRIRTQGRGWVFTPADFADLGSHAAVRVALMRHAHAGTIRQLAHGLYDYPRKSRILKGFVPPSDDDIAKALNDRHSTRVQLSGGHAANMLGISTQVPMRTVFITDGPARKVKIGRREIVLKKASPRQLATAGRVSGELHAGRWVDVGTPQRLAELDQELKNA